MVGLIVKVLEPQNVNDMEKNEKEKLVFMQDEKLKASRFRYDGWHVKICGDCRKGEVTI